MFKLFGVRFLAPVFRVAPALGSVVHQKSKKQQDQGTASNREQCVYISGLVKMRATDYGNKCSDTSWRVQCFGEVHTGNSRSYG